VVAFAVLTVGMDFMLIRRIGKHLLVILGSLCIGLGAIGIFIPVLPTTPFLLLACYFYLRSSQRLYDWLINHRILGIYIYNYLTYKAIPKKTKIGALVYLWLGLSISIYAVAVLHLRVFLSIVGIAVSIHILSLKTIRTADLLAKDVSPKVE
jgi:uncharacterized membrane protein YbaN (DUF454 family)